MSDHVPAGGCSTGPGAASALATALIDIEAERLAANDVEPTLFADDLLPGVGDESISLREGIARGGLFTFVVLTLLNTFDELEVAALRVLAPDIRDTFGVGDGVIVFISAATGATIVLGAVPMGWLADRFRRGPIIGFASAAFGGLVMLSGLAVNAFMLFCARFGVGIAKSNTIPVHGSLLADTYPIGIRGRLSATTMGTGLAIGALSPVLVGGIAELAGGSEGWRWPFFLLGLPVLVLAVVAFRLPEPVRGQQEMASVLGGLVDGGTAEISMEAAFARLGQIKTFKAVVLGFAAIGFGLFTDPVLGNLYVEDRFGLDAFERGIVDSAGGLLAIAVMPFAARRYDRAFRQNPARALRLVGLLIAPVAVLKPIQYAMPNVVGFAIVGLVPTALLMTAFTMVGPVTQSVVPYRLRGMGFALASIYLFFVGATLGALIAAVVAESAGPRPAVLALVPPATLIGGLLIMRGATSIRHDMSLVVAELQQDLAEAERQRAAPEDTPKLQVQGIDFSYGNVQVLFDVGFEVRRGEVLALLGTNGAGKSTILRVIAGLGTPGRGAVRLDGSVITYVSPERRGALGVRMLPGGKGVFPQMTVYENLEVAAFAYRDDPPDQARRIDRVLDLFGALAERQGQRAGSLSGGQQQMLALAAVLLHEPDVLLIDELSLGLSPIVVADLIGVVERLRDGGTTIVVVEQSLNVALSIADRAIFLEKGRVRFDGDARELAQRDDLARAVFLGTEGG